jgi:hypothetical protein
MVSGKEGLQSESVSEEIVVSVDRPSDLACGKFIDGGFTKPILGFVLRQTSLVLQTRELIRIEKQ